MERENYYFLGKHFSNSLMTCATWQTGLSPFSNTDVFPVSTFLSTSHRVYESSLRVSSIQRVFCVGEVNRRVEVREHAPILVSLLQVDVLNGRIT